MHTQGQTVDQSIHGLPVDPIPNLTGQQMPNHGQSQSQSQTVYNNNIPVARAPPGFATMTSVNFHLSLLHKHFLTFAI